MQKLIAGLHRFASEVFLSHKELFDRLSHGQSPEALFITCADSRINPNLITQTDPGDLFILRNAGNLIPPHGFATGGEAATIELAVASLHVKDVIVCGHTLCGAMKGVLHPEEIGGLPALATWLNHAEGVKRILQENYSGLSEESLLNTAVQENVLAQLEHLQTHPAVAAKLSSREITLHGWVYKIETGQVFGYQPQSGQFLPLTDGIAPAWQGIVRPAALNVL